MITYEKVIRSFRLLYNLLYETFGEFEDENIDIIYEFITQQEKVVKLLELYQKFVHDLDVTLEKGVVDDDLALLENIDDVTEYEYINIGWSKGDLVETFKKIKEIEENEIE